MNARKLLPALAALSLTFASIARAAPNVILSGVPNFYQVNAHLYRGGQPTDAAWSGLAKLGVTTVIDLRQTSEHSTVAEAKAVESAGMRYRNFPMDGFDMPQAESIARILEAMPATETVFIHCKRGKDRTGTVVAAYRMEREGWKNDRALAEAEACGMQWFSRGMKRFIGAYRTTPLAPTENATASMTSPALATADTSTTR